MNAKRKSIDPFEFRKKMVEGQLIPSNIQNEQIVNALVNVPREEYLPDALQNSAYVDEVIHFGEGQFMLSCLTMAQLLLLANIKAHQKVLLLANDGGYSAALLAEMKADIKLFTTKDNENNSFDLMLIVGACEELPESLISLLKVNGRIIGALKNRQGLALSSYPARMTSWQKNAGILQKELHYDISAPLIPALDEKKSFVF